MSLFNWLTSTNQVTRCSDTYSLTLDGKWTGIADAIEQERRHGRATVVVSHFANSFFDLQSILDERMIAYYLLDRPLSPEQLGEWISGCSPTANSPHRLILVIADLLIDGESNETKTTRSHTSIIVTERHPLRSKDKAVDRYARGIPGRVRQGYFVSLEDAFVRRAIGEWMPILMKQLGMNDHELITSHLINRRLETAQRKLARRVATDKRADSAEEWLQLNDPNYAK